MNSTFFIGDLVLINKRGMTQENYTFVGAKKKDGTNKWQIDLIYSAVNGYAGGSANVTWIVSLQDELRVSGSMRGFVTVDGFNNEKIKEKRIKALIFKEIECDRLAVEYVM